VGAGPAVRLDVDIEIEKTFLKNKCECNGISKKANVRSINII